MLRWLEFLELPQHVQSFKEASIGGQELEGLDEGDLQELGVTSKFHRRKILNRLKSEDDEQVQVQMQHPAAAGRHIHESQGQMTSNQGHDTDEEVVDITSLILAKKQARERAAQQNAIELRDEDATAC